MNSIRKRILEKTGVVLFVLCLLSLFEMFSPEIAKANVFDDAYSFYNQYGSDMTFCAGEYKQGEIYYATKAKKNEHTGIRYTTIGWQVRVFNGAGALVETIYYQLGGSNMSSIDTRTVNGHVYRLYCVTLENLKSRLSSAGRKALNNPDCNIIFDACTTTKLNGVVQGGMTDQGPSWGEVYTTYNGIVNAKDWSSATRETLKSYYNKSVEGLFYDVNIVSGPGIAQTLGAGRYCFGTEVTIKAQPSEGYHFGGWTGTESITDKNYTFVLYNQDVTYIANAKENTYTIQFNAGGGQGNIPAKVVSFTSEFVTPLEGFSLEESTMSGWKTENEIHRFTRGKSVSVRNLVQDLGLQNDDGAIITLYADWDHGPIITTKEIFVQLSDATTGKITEAWLANRAEALDEEDGKIPYGKNEKTSFLLSDYLATEFTEADKEKEITKTFFAVDSVGNVTEKKVVIHIVDNQIYPTTLRTGRVRFISKRYFWGPNGGLLEEKYGGLEENSIWRINEEYRKILEELFK